MDGVTTEFRGDHSVFYYSSFDAERLETTLTLVAAWRCGPATTHGWRARLKRWQYRLGIDPIHRRFSIGRDAGLWFGFAGSHSEQETLLHARRRVVRVLGREYSLPARGMTLVLLIDESRAPANVRVKVMQGPTLPRTTAQLNPDAPHRECMPSAAEIAAWREFLLRDAEFAAFVPVGSATW